MKTKSFREWSDTGQLIATDELDNKEIKRIEMLPDTIELFLYEYGYVIQVSSKGIFSYNKEFISMSLLEVEKFIYNHYVSKML